MGSNVYYYHRQQQESTTAAVAGGESRERRSRSALPMLCSRNSIKDVSLPIIPSSSGSGSRTPFSSGNQNEDPLSPKIGCMGQVKRNNRIGGFPASSSSSSSSSNSHSSSSSSVASKFVTSLHPPPLPAVKYLKLKRVFSARNLTTTTGHERPVRIHNKNNNVDVDRRQKPPPPPSSTSDMAAVKIEEIDPPLPVRSGRFETTAGAGASQSEKSLWERRRSGGSMGLKNLELQGIIVNQQRLQHILQPTTV